MVDGVQAEAHGVELSLLWRLEGESQGWVLRAEDARGRAREAGQERRADFVVALERRGQRERAVDAPVDFDRARLRVCHPVFADAELVVEPKLLHPVSPRVLASGRDDFYGERGGQVGVCFRAGSLQLLVREED